MENHVVIMAGGIGSRFWPMSVPDYPKQFIDVMGCGKSLIQLTIERFCNVCSMQNFWIVTSEKYVDIVKEQLPGIPECNILAEPEARNTAPCIAYACWKIAQKHKDANIVITPSDAIVINTAEFERVIKTALDFTASRRSIVTVGIKPSRPETGYGYICRGNSIDNSEICHVDGFKEKPDYETACRYMEDGNFLWNAGIFVWNIDTIITEIRTHTPALAGIMDRMAVDFFTEKETATVKELFPTCEKISIDYAVMEKAKSIYTIPADFGWSDLGTWGSLHSLLPKNSNNNAVVGNNVKMYDCNNCVVHTSENKQVVIEGLDGYIIAERGNRLLVCRLDNEQEIKKFV